MWSPTFDIGFDAFGLVGAAAEGGIDVEVGYNAEVGFKIDKQHGVSILLNADDSGNPELEAGISLALQDGTKLELDLFFLKLAAINQDTDGDGNKTIVSASASVDFGFAGDEVPILDLLDIDLTPALSAEVFVDLRLEATVEGNKNLPSIRADLLMGWEYELGGPIATP